MKKYNQIMRKILGLLLLFVFIPIAAQNNEGNDNSLTKATTTGAVNLVSLKGRILDATTGTPVLGASVRSKDQQFAAMTNEEGTFTIQIPEYLTLLSVSASGYDSFEYPIQGKSEINIKLFPALEPIRNRSTLTADGEIPFLSGGGVRTITRSGTPGIGAAMFIRGYNSLNIGAQPLIVLDGVVFDNQNDRLSIHDGFALNPLSNIDVNDIESVKVIKNGTSLYGSKGGNGVLLIDTKRGKDVVTKITFSTMVGLNQRPETMPLLDAEQFRVYVSDLYKDYYKDPSYLSSQAFLNDDPNYYDYHRYHNSNDWSKDVYRNSLTQSYNIGVSGGDNIALYNLSIGIADANSTLKAGNFNRFNARFNSDIHLTKKFDISFDLAYAQTENEMRNDGFSENKNDIVSSPGILSMIKSPFLIPYEYSNDGKIMKDLSDVDFLDIANPVALIENGIGENSQTYLSLQIRPSFKFSNSLTASGIFSYSMNNMFEKYFRPDAGVASSILFYDKSLGSNSLPVYSHSFVKAQNAKQISLNAGLSLNWKKKMEIHEVDVTGGARFLSDSYKGEFGSGHNTSTDRDHNLSNSLLDRYATGYDDNWRSFSWYINADYSLYEKYLISLIATADASSRFGKDADLTFKAAGVNWAVFPEVNAAWLISSENFMSKLSFVDLLKLRVGYGFAGNDNIPHASSLTYFSSLRYIKEYTGKTLTNIGNTKLKPETVEKRNAGLDASLFNNRLRLSADIYQHITSDLLALKGHKFISGKDTYWTNGGKLENKGYELTLNAKVLALRNFQWEIGGSLSHNKNEIVELPEGDYTTSIYGGEIKTSVGNPAGLFYGYKTNGVFSTTQEAADADLKILNSTGVGYTSFAAGDIRFADLDNNGIIDNRDKTIIGDPNPDFTGTFTTQFVFKRISLNALFTYSYGNDIYNYARSQMESGSANITTGGNYVYNQSSALQNRWVSEGQQTSIPKIAYSDPLGNGRFSDRWIEDGSYIRLKSLSIAYEVPLNWMFLSGFTIWASANNLWTYTKYLGNDPEFSVSNSILYQGIDAGLLSQGRSYFIGLKLNL